MLVRLIGLILKELLAVLRDPRSRMILIGPPIIQLLVFSFAATQEVRNVRLGILDLDGTQAAHDLVARFEGSPTFSELMPLASVADIAPALDSRRVMAVLHIGQDFSARLERGEPVAVQVILDGRNSNSAQILQRYCAAIVEQYAQSRMAERGMPGNPTQLDVRTWFNPNRLDLWAIVPSLMGILTMVIGLVVTALSIARERELGTFEQLLVTPLRPWEILVGKTVPGVIIGIAEGSLIFAAALLIFRIPFTGSVGLLYLALLIFVLSIVGIGLSISSVSQTQQQAVLGGFMFMMPAVVLSGFATPIENMPQWLQTLTLANPLRHFLTIVKGVFLKDMPASLVLQLIMPMAIIALITLPIAVAMVHRRLH